VSLIDINSTRVLKTIGVTPFPGAPPGSSPNALALLDADHLLISLGRNNAVAMYRLANSKFGALTFEGLIPTGWYPTDVAVDSRSRRLIVANGKGVGSLGPESPTRGKPGKTGHNVHSSLGSASIIAFPNRSELWSYTQRVHRNNNEPRLGRKVQTRRARRLITVKGASVPERTGEPPLFKHVFYIIKENRTYERKGTGIPISSSSDAT
jgi:hypothetical protein